MTLEIDRSVGADSITNEGRDDEEILFSNRLSACSDHPCVRICITRSSKLSRRNDELDMLIDRDQARAFAAILNRLADA